MRTFLTAIILSSIAWFPAQAADKPTAAQLTAFFEDVVFGSEYTKKGSGEVKKWTGPLRVSLSAMTGKLLDKPDGGKELKLAKAKPTKQQIDFVRKHLKTLIQASRVKSESAKKSGKKPNLFIKFVPRRAMHAPFLVKGAPPKLLKRLAAPGVCYFLTAAKSGQIVWGTIVVNNALPARDMEACLLEEMTQVLGLPNDSDAIKPSIFNNRSQPTALNRTDQLLLRTLYDKRLKAGMAKDQAMAVAGQIIQELNRKMP